MENMHFVCMKRRSKGFPTWALVLEKLEAQRGADHGQQSEGCAVAWHGWGDFRKPWVSCC